MASVSPTLTLKIDADFDVVKTNETVDAIFLLHLAAPKTASDQTVLRPRLNIVVVGDRSGSMGGVKIHLLRQTVKIVLSRLLDGDSFAFVVFDDQVKVLVPSTVLTTTNRTTINGRIDKLVDRGRTNLCDGLLKGLDEVVAGRWSCLEAGTVSSVFLLTDGDANESFTQAKQIVHLMRCRPDQRAHQTAAMRSNPRYLETHMEAQRYASLPCSVYTFAYCTTDERVLRRLKEIAEAGHGVNANITDERLIFEVFGECFGGLASTCAKNITMKITGSSTAILGAVHSPFTTVRDGANNAVTINLPDMQSEENRDLLVDVELKPLPESVGSINVVGIIAGLWRAILRQTSETVVSAEFSFDNLHSGVRETHHQNIVIPRGDTTQSNHNKQIQVHRIRSAVAVKQAEAAAAISTNLDQAKQLLGEAKKIIVDSPVATDPLCMALLEEVNDALDGLSSAASTGQAQANLYSASTANQYQRSSGPTSFSSHPAGARGSGKPSYSTSHYTSSARSKAAADFVMVSQQPNGV